MAFLSSWILSFIRRKGKSQGLERKIGCSQVIELLVEGDVILDAAFHGGCNGNLKGIVALCKGQKISDVKNRLSGIICGAKSTSCPDQFAQLLAAVENK